MPTERMVIEGHVQGVGFRAYVQRLATRLGVRGEAWNRADDAVEVIAQHEQRPVLLEFEKLLHFGPGHVSHIRGDEFPDAPEFTNFRITFRE